MSAVAEVASDVPSGYRLAKRVTDVVLAGSALVALSPVLAAVALAVRLESKGPVLFMQTRYGIGRSTFKCLKFRTMTVTEDGAAFRQAVSGDVRVTRVGRFLRASSIDELPQLVNVLLGQMSIVGPRPHPTALDDAFAPRIAGYDGRFSVKPGLTGLAQVRGQRGPTPDVATMASRVASDLEYAERRNLILDASIVARTIPAVLGHTNAY